MGPRTRQKWLRKVLKSGWTASVVADQYSSNWMPVKTLAGTNGAASDGSSTLFNSATEGSRQPVVPPTFLLRQSNRACNQSRVVVSGDCPHTSPVLLSRTALLLKSFRIVKRDALGRFLSQFWVTPCKSDCVAGGAAATIVTPKPELASKNPPTSGMIMILLPHVFFMVSSCGRVGCAACVGLRRGRFAPLIFKHLSQLNDVIRDQISLILI